MATVVPSASLERCMHKALGTCQAVAPQIEYLEDLAKACPEIDASVSELRVFHDHLNKMCRVGLGKAIADNEQHTAERA